MELFQLAVDDFEKYREGMRALLKEAVEYSFRDNLPDENYYAEKIARLKEYLVEDKAVVFLLVDEENLFAWAWCHPIVRFNKKRLHIASIAVKHGTKNKGYGSKVFLKIEEYAKLHQYDGIDLLVTADNQSAVHFYDTKGMTVERYTMKKDFWYE